VVIRRQRKIFFHRMNDWEAVHDSKSALDDLTKELGKKRENWRQLQDQWHVRPRSQKKQSSPTRSSISYLSGAMAESLSNAHPHRACLFEASIRQMNGNQIREIGRLPVQPEKAHNAVPDADQFSTDLASIPQDKASARAMIDFSRFLLELAGEKELASGRDPIRTVDSKDFYPNPHAMKNDRLIR
jgi:hypothetical protein